MTKLATFSTRGGARFTVADEHRARFEALLNDLEAAGYAIKGNKSGGYNYRTIAGTNKLSEHAHGNAVDVNWDDNARGTKGNIPAELARELARRHNMVWGGDWKNPDPMHFEIAHGQPGHVHVAGDEGPQRGAATAQTQAAPQGGDMDWLSMILGKIGGGTAGPAGGGAGAGGQAAAAQPASGIPLPFGIGRLQAPGAGQQMPQPPAPAQMPDLAPLPQRQPIDMTRLAQIIANRSRLGV